MRLKKSVTGGLAVAFAALGLVSGSGVASADNVGTQYWSDRCDPGKACLNEIRGRVWNVPGCGVSGLDGHYEWATAHGNAFKVTYANRKWDRVEAGTQRALDGGNRAVEVHVYC